MKIKNGEQKLLKISKYFKNGKTELPETCDLQMLQVDQNWYQATLGMVIEKQNHVDLFT